MRLLLRCLAVLVLLVMGDRAAHAYPQWQFTTGTVRCNQCHYAPGGGGVLRPYARDFVGDELSTFGGNGAPLHGSVELPAWLAVGGDTRVAFVAHEAGDPNGAKVAVFPMQFDLAARVALAASLSFQGTLGLRGRLRNGSDDVPLQNYQPITASWLVSREHFVTWQPAFTGPYVRLGRFYTPFGLRLAEHVVYVRRDLGFNLLEESYNLSGGFIDEDWELHLTAFAPDFLRHIGSQEAGGALYVERRVLNQQGAVAAQFKYGDAPGWIRMVGGLVGKFHIEPLRTLLFAEGNIAHLEFPSVAASTQFVGAAGASALPGRGFMVTALAERLHRDVVYRTTATNAATLLFNWFPYAHIEVQAMGRLQFPSGTSAIRTFLLQLHYYL